MQLASYCGHRKEVELMTPSSVNVPLEIFSSLSAFMDGFELSHHSNYYSQ